MTTQGRAATAIHAAQRCAAAATHASPRPATRPLCFIETQFPVAELSHECAKERRAGATQTLTGLGKWWGRKPLVLARATLLGVLLPASGNPRRDRAVFLKLMQMDDDGLLRRRHVPLRLRDLYAVLADNERRRHFTDDSTPERPRWRTGLTRAQRKALQRTAFLRLPYAERLKYCRRPEHVGEGRPPRMDGLTAAEWAEINAHLGTSADSLPALLRELGQRRFGRPPRIGDAFCGGGAIPFEAARLGCDVYAADLSPVAALQTWVAIHVLGGDDDVHARVKSAQRRVLAAVERRVTDWSVEHDAAGNRAEYFLYCTETTCPQCGWAVPVAPSWLISQSHGAVAMLVPRTDQRRFDVKVRTGCDPAALAAAKNGTLRRFTLICPHCRASTKMSVLRGDAKGGPRRWASDKVVPRDDDVLRERLYAIRWLDRDGHVRFRTPTSKDHEREQRVRTLLAERFDEWQRRGFLPRRAIEPGVETTRLGRERGWTHWQHLFAPRQLLLHGLLHAESARFANDPHVYAALLLGTGACANWNSRLCVWNPDRSKGPGSTEQTFLNLALNTLNNYGVRGLATVRDTFAIRLNRSRNEAALPPSLPGRGQGERRIPPSLTGSGQGAGRIPPSLLGRGQGKGPGERESHAPASAPDNGPHSRVPAYLPSHTHVGRHGGRPLQNGTAAPPLDPRPPSQGRRPSDPRLPSQGGPQGGAAILPADARASSDATVLPADARAPCPVADVWITDPPYADAVNYHELSEFFLAWLEGRLPAVQPAWPTDSRRDLAVKSAGGGFRAAMIDCYRNLAARTAPAGVQLVLFTHHDPAVWADLALTLCAAGLRVTAAWCVRTECDTAGYKRGRYVQETVVLVLRRNGITPAARAPDTHAADRLLASPATGPTADAYAAVEREVARRLALRAATSGGDDGHDPDAGFCHSGSRGRGRVRAPAAVAELNGDVRLLAYAAALTVATRDGLDGGDDGIAGHGGDSKPGDHAREARLGDHDGDGGLTYRIHALIEHALACAQGGAPSRRDMRLQSSTKCWKRDAAPSSSRGRRPRAPEAKAVP